MKFAELKALHGFKSWRSIKGFPGYRVTHCGRVWSCAAEKFVRQSYNVDSYLRVELWSKGVRHWRFVHRLVCDHYKRNRHPKTHTQVNHKDWDRHNNHGDNLEHVTPGENIRHSKRRYGPYVYKGKDRWIKLTYEQQKERDGTPF